MHIHYNTNQTTLPLELACVLPQGHIVFIIFIIEKVVNALEDGQFQSFYMILVALPITQSYFCLSSSLLIPKEVSLVVRLKR